MTTPRAVTEEFHRRVPAGEFYGTKYISEKFYFTPRLRFQILQNEFILGLGYLLHQNSKWGFSAEVSGSVWAGVFKTEAYNRKGYGFMGYPAVKAGFKLKEDLMLTMKGELILNLARRDVAGQISQSLPSPFYSGEAISFYVEQPFFKKTSVILGFRGMYCDFYWQTWTLNENFERNIFYPEIIIELIL